MTRRAFMGGVASAAADNGTAKVVPSASDVVIVPVGTAGNAAAWTMIAVACLVTVAVGVFAATHIRFTPDLPASTQQTLQDLPVGLMATSPDHHAPMAGAHLTGEHAALDVLTALDGATAGCGSCDARHRNLGRLGESKAP
jgi:hypothetical protein